MTTIIADKRIRGVVRFIAAIVCGVVFHALKKGSTGALKLKLLARPCCLQIEASAVIAVRQPQLRMPDTAVTDQVATETWQFTSLVSSV